MLTFKSRQLHEHKPERNLEQSKNKHHVKLQKKQLRLRDTAIGLLKQKGLEMAY